jgi:hypothetical protein
MTICVCVVLNEAASDGVTDHLLGSRRYSDWIDRDRRRATSGRETSGE